MRPQDEIALIRDRLKHYPVKEQPRLYLDTGDESLNAVLGNRERGIPWESIIELFGWESCGKSLTAMIIMAMAVDAGGYGIWVDFESSWDEEWMNQWGLYHFNKPPKGIRRVALLQPYEGFFGRKPGNKKKGKKFAGQDALVPDLATAQNMFAEAEELIMYRHRKYPEKPIICVVDSITAIQTDDDDLAGVENRNLSTDMSTPKFLGRLFKRWIRLVRTQQVIGIFINQLRTNPMQMFGNPEYTPGGKALRFFAHVRCKVGLIENGVLTSGKVKIGLKGKIRNVKNKRGNAFQLCGYRYKFKSGDATFYPYEEKGDK